MSYDEFPQFYWIIAAFIVVEIATIIFYMLPRYKRAQLLKSDQAMQAKAIVRKKYTSSGKHGVRHTADISFRDWQGVEVSGSANLDKALWESLAEGQEIPVTYVRSHPTVFVIQDRVDERIKIEQMLLIAISLSVVFLSVIAFLIHITS